MPKAQNWAVCNVFAQKVVYYRYMKILVTGGAGYIGSAVTAALLALGHEVTVFDDFSTGQKSKVPSGARVIAGNITDAAAIAAVCADGTFGAVFHFAAKKAVAESEKNPALYFTTNVVGSQNLLAAMTAAKIPRLIFSSTAAVYDPTYTIAPVTEDTLLGPVSVYGSSKQIVEALIQAYGRTRHLPHYTILRYFNVAGDAGLDYREAAAENVFPVIARTLGSAQPFTIFGTDYDTKDGTCIRDYIHLKDLVAGHVAALEAEESGIFNLGTGTGYSVRELVAAFNNALPTPLLVTEQARRSGDAPQVVADATRARTILGWQPTHTLKEMVEDTLRVYR